jgi:hypothetical protein
MALSLDCIQLELEQHFRVLAVARTEAGHSVFALEHGLSHDEVARLEAALREHFHANGLNEKYWLVWVVYAAEQGYNYDGEEYWHSFEERTKSWREYGNRQKIRIWFNKFRNMYFGIRPTGTWATHFSIISWPITHAVLPRDLQEQLARSLYNARYRLGNIKSMSAENVGRLIAASSHNPSARFRFFLGQEELVGQIVLALLEHSPGNVGRILPLTLERIVDDLNTVRTARDWLHDARQVVYTAAQFKLPVAARGIGPQNQPIIGNAQKDSESQGEENAAIQVLLRPTLKARRNIGDSWSVDISIPTFQPLANLSTEYAAFIRRTRIIIPCTGTSRLPAGWLLSGLRQREITSWPDDGECLIRFETSPAPFDEILKSECQLPPGPVWPFKLNVFGIGQMLLGQVLQPDQRYLILSRQPISLGSYAQNCSIKCNGLYGAVLTVPKQVTDALSSSLTEIGLTTSRSIKIEPVGLMPRQWDGEGSGEWLTNEQPCFQITRDHDFDTYELNLDGADRLKISCGLNNDPVLVQLGPMEAGQHTLMISTGLSAEISAKCVLTLFVRQPSAWVPDTLSYAGMMVDVTPAEPSVDDFLNGEMELEVFGDKSRSASCSVIMVDSMGIEIDRSLVFKHNLPITRSVWEKALTAFLSKEIDDLSYLKAADGYILVNGEDLGDYRIPLARHYGPLRWFCQKRKEGVFLRLINDGDDEGLTTFFFGFEKPLDKTVLNSSDCLHGIPINSPGGLFIADKAGIKNSVVIAPLRTSVGLEELQCKIDSTLIDACSDIICLLNSSQIWREATLSGFLANHKRNKVVVALEDRIFTLLCGNYWVRLERKVRENASNQKLWEGLEASVNHHINFAIALSKAWQLANDEASLKKRFVEISTKHEVCSEMKLIDAAWQITSVPHSFATEAGDEINDLLNSLEQNKVLVRGARLLFLSRKLRTANTEIHS